MTYNIDYETEPGWDFDAEKLYKRVVDTVLDEEDCPYEAEVSLLITDNASIREINRQSRDIDKVTDVLSFPMVQYDVAGDFSHVEEMDDCFNIETGELMLGDIVLSADKVKEQAVEFGHNIEREYAFLIAHSMLHLIGYDHIRDEDRVVMEDKQRLIMELLGISR